MSPVHDAPIDVVLKDHATFQRFLHKSCAATSRSWDSICSENSSISSVSPSNHDAQGLMEKENLRLRLSENEMIIAALREQVIDTINTSARLSQQLKQAVASKCDLVVTCSKIESQKLSMQENFEKDYRKAQLKPLKERELRAQVEKEFMNEIEGVLAEINDMHRRHRNAMLEKDLEIAQLQKRIHQEQSKRSN
jgi:hypothetical protein